MGFGGPTLTLIKSLYRNDTIKFLINGKYTDPIWLSLGVKQGTRWMFSYTVIAVYIVGCNLSPLLFSIFINSLGVELNKSSFGIPLGKMVISCLCFADDLVVIAKSKETLDELMMITRRYFSDHHLTLSEDKSKVMTYDASNGYTTFMGNQEIPSLSLENVLEFRYLGIRLSTSPYAFFNCHNENMKSLAIKYMHSVLSLVKRGPDRASLAFTLWKNCALPAILYGCEIVPLNQKTIDEIERCQCRVGKFILQIHRNSSNASVAIDAGLQPVWSLVAEKVATYPAQLLDKPCDYWARIAYEENISMGVKSSYTTYLNKCKSSIDGYGIGPMQLKKNARHAAINSSLRLQTATSKTSFAMNPYRHSEAWFRMKPWVSDSGMSKLYAEFRSCNSGLGNRAPRKDGQTFKLCPLCEKIGLSALNNEVHLLFDCPIMETYRNQCEVGRFLQFHRRMQPQISSFKLYAMFLNDRRCSNLKETILSLYHMRLSWDVEIGKLNDL